MFKITVTQPRDVRNAWIIWSVVLTLMLVNVLLPVRERTVTGAYRSGAQQWLQGADLYNTNSIHGFLYLPSTAILFAPIASLPYTLGELVWRCICIGSIAWAIWRLARFAGQGGRWELFPLMTLVAIPPLLSSARNGQMNLPLAACMVFSAVNLAEKRWWRSAFFLALGVALKPHMIVAMLLTAGVSRSMAWRCGIGLAAVLLLPFLLGSPAYNARQYSLFYETAVKSSQPEQFANLDPGANNAFVDVFGMTTGLGLHVPDPVRTVIRLAAAVAALVATWYGFVRWGHQRGAVLLLVMASSYLLLFNPRTENNTYALLAPSLAVFAAWTMLVERKHLQAGFIIVVSIGLMLSYEITRGSTIRLSPMLCLLFVIYVLYRLVSGKPPAEGQWRQETT